MTLLYSALIVLVHEQQLACQGEGAVEQVPEVSGAPQGCQRCPCNYLRRVHNLGSCHFIAASDRECENLEIRWLLFEGMIFCSNCCQLWNKTGGSATCEVCSALRLKGLDDRSVGRLGLVVAVEEQGSGGCTPRLVTTGQ